MSLLRVLCALGFHAYGEPVFERGALVRLRCVCCRSESSGWTHQGAAATLNRQPRLLFIRRKKKKMRAA